MSEARATIDGLSKEFDRSVIQTKPGSAKKPATKYVSHGSVTKRLNAICPGWSSRVVETYTYVNPAGLLVCAGVLLELTIPGVGSRQEFGTANQPRNFGDDAKNAASDALKRAAMRFGVALDLWEDMDEADEDVPAPRPPAYVSPYARSEAPQPNRYPDMTWIDFKKWAKPRGYDSRAECEKVIKLDTTDWLPGQIRTGLETRGGEVERPAAYAG